MVIDQEVLRKIQLLQLDMVKKIHSICEKLNCRYIILSGTLLGAVRHKGFIPWDDDLDIGLPRADYQKLLNYLKKHPIKGCFLQTYETDKHYMLPYAKLRLDNTLYIETYWENVDMHQGVFIDIFPLDKIKQPGGKLTEIRRIIAKELTFAIWRKEHCHVVRKGRKKIETVISSVIALLPKTVLMQIQNSIVIREKKYWKYTASMFTSNYDTKRVFFDKKALNNRILLDFEDTKLFAPNNYKKQLELLYHDYMKLPPENKRNSGHNVVRVSV